MSRAVDAVIAYRILNLLVTPFVETEAYRLGIIDENGKELKKMKDLNSVAERDAYTILHRMIYRLKKIVEKVPIENKKLSSLAAAYSLIKEHHLATYEPLDLELQFLDRLNNNLQEDIVQIENFLSGKQFLSFRQFMEEIPANNAGTPGIAGFTPDTMGVPVSVQRKRRNIFKRSEVQNVGSSKKIFRN